MSGESRRKVVLDELINELIESIKKADNDKSLQQFQRTKLYQRAAQKLKSRMYEDGRRSDKTRLSLMSYRRYLSTVRKTIRGLEWRHHSLPKAVDRLSRKYPEYKKRLHKLLSLKSDAMRAEHKALCQELKSQYKAAGEKKYRNAYDEFKVMFLDHDILRHLSMKPTDQEDIEEADRLALEKKKTNTISINYHWIISEIERLTSLPSYSYQALGLAFACGRRPVEILYQGRFKANGEFTIEFSGQAKERGGADYERKFTIYTLIPAKQFIEKLEDFRELEPVKALKQYDDLPETKRNTEINRRTAKSLAEATKKTFENAARKQLGKEASKLNQVEAIKRAFGNGNPMFKWSRGIWSRAVFTLHFEKDDRWKNADEDIFWREMLGHAEIETQEFYKYIKLDFSEIKDTYQEPVYVNKQGENIRVKRLMKLAGDYRIANRKALVKINEYIMQAITDDHKASFTRSSVSRALGSNRVAINDYFTLIEDHYGAMLADPAKAAAKPAKETNQEQPEKEEKPKKKTATKKAAAKKKTTKAKPKTTAKKAKATK